MKLSKILLIAGIVATLALLAPGPQTQAGNPPGDSPEIGGPEYWGVLVIACSNLEVSLRVKRVVNCIVETDQVIERYPAAFCPAENEPGFTANQLIGQWFGYDGCLFRDAQGQNGIPGVPIITKVKNLKRRHYVDNVPQGQEYTGDIYTADVQIRFCTNCAPHEAI